MHLVLENLSKTYSPNVQALRGVDLSLQPGVLGLLGPNGAGKSTLMRILATVTRASSGWVHWNTAEIARDPDVLGAVSAICRRTLAYTRTLAPWNSWNILLQ